MRHLFFCALLALFGGSLVHGQNQQADFNKPFPPHKVIGTVYYVGSEQLASFLITTPDGHILVNSSFETTVPVIRAAVEKLGFKFTDIKILIGSHAHNVLISCSIGVNPGYVLVDNKDYPEIAADYVRSFKVMRSLPVDVFLGAHGNFYNLTEKYARLEKGGGANPFIDPEGFKQYVDRAEKTFQTRLEEQKAKQ